MTDKKISELTAIDSVVGTDLLPIVDDSASATKKATATQLKDFVVGAGSVSVASGKTLTTSNTLTLAGTDSTTMTFPSTSATLARTDAAQTFTGAQTITGGTLNGTVLDITQTWGGTGTYTGLKYNVTDSGPSNAASLLMDLQVGGASRFRVDKSGGITCPTYATHSFVDGNIRLTGNSWIYTTAGIRVGSTGSVSFSSAANDTNIDTILTRRGAANLRLGAANVASPAAQTLSVQGRTGTDASAAAFPFTIQGAQGTGTGAGGSIVFQVAPAGGAGSTPNAFVTFAEMTSARAFNLYNTTDATTNFERGKIAWESNVLRIGTEKGGTGTARALELQTDGTTRLTIASTSGDVTTTGSVTTAAPTGGTAAAWKLGTVASVSPTSPNRTIEVDIAGTIYYISAKTTND